MPLILFIASGFSIFYGGQIKYMHCCFFLNTLFISFEYGDIFYKISIQSIFTGLYSKNQQNVVQTVGIFISYWTWQSDLINTILHQKKTDTDAHWHEHSKHHDQRLWSFRVIVTPYVSWYFFLKSNLAVVVKPTLKCGGEYDKIRYLFFGIIPIWGQWWWQLGTIWSLI